MNDRGTALNFFDPNFNDPASPDAQRWMALDTDDAMIVLETETVHTVNDYWDGPCVGVADFKGQPHYFEGVFDEASDDWSSVFWLHSLDPETFNLVMENWRLWERWQDAFDEERVNADSHPCLPEDRVMNDANSIVLKERLRIDPANDIQAKGQFCDSWSACSASE